MVRSALKGNAFDVQLDGAGRILLPANLREKAAIDREVVIVGRAGQAEIWDATEFAAFEAENLTPEKLLASLEAIGL